MSGFTNDGVENFETPFLPMPSGITGLFQATVGNSAQRLGALITLPDLSTVTAGAPTGTRKRPKHVVFAVPTSETNTVYMSADNNTAPTTSMGLEIQPGTERQFTYDNWLMLANAASAFQFIAAANTKLNIHFFE